MTIKYRFDDYKTFDREIRTLGCGNDPYFEDKRTVNRWAYTDMVRHRTRPKLLLPTDAMFREVHPDGDFTAFGCASHQWSPQFRSGDHMFVHSGHTGTAYSFGSTGTKENAAKLRAGSSFTSQIGDFGETFATLTETGTMIGKRASQLARLAWALKKGNFKKVADILGGAVPGRVSRLPPHRRLADGWLELEFGWKPLVSDVYSGIEAYHNRLKAGQQLSSGRKWANPGGFNPGKRPGSPLGTDSRGTQGTFDRMMTSGSNASARVYGVVSDPNLATLNQMGLANPALLAWQLLPFSFVVDWFLPISQILSYMTNNVGLTNYIGVSVTETGSYLAYPCGRYGNIQRTVTRKVYVPSLIPPVGKVSFRNLGIWHAGTGTALLSQAFGRRTR